MDNETNNNGHYSFDENALSHASMSSFESQPNNTGFTQIPNQSFTADETFTAGGLNDFATNEFAQADSYTYAFNENTLPQPTVNNLWQPMSSTYQEMLEGQYAFDQFALPQPATTNAFDFDFPNISQPPGTFDSNVSWGANTSIHHQALEHTLTDLSMQSGFALSGDTTASLQPTFLTGLELDAPFKADQSEKNQSRNFNRPSMDDSLTCPWRGCNKTTPFKTEKLLQTHLDNIHLNPLYCTQQGCSYSRPFPKKGDLDRHLATKHGIGRLFRCPRRECPRHARPFGRKDKLREHVNKERHGLVHCQYSHCDLNSLSGLFAKEDMAKHETSRDEYRGHGEYECAIGVCEGSISFFSYGDMRLHLVNNHNVYYRSKPVQDLFAQGLKRFTLADVNKLPDECYWRLKGVKTTCDECEKNGSNRTTSSV